MIKKIGNRISRIRKGKDLTQANMAEELNITTSAYSKIERGDTDAPTSRLLQIAKVLEVNVTEFFEDKVLSFNEDQKYGFASKEQVDNLEKTVSTLVKEIEKLTQALPKIKKEKKKKYSLKK